MDNSKSECVEDEDIAFMTIKLNAFLKKKSMTIGGMTKNSRKNIKSAYDIIALNIRDQCILNECPSLKNQWQKDIAEEKRESRKYKRKTKHTFWINSDSDSSKIKLEEEIINICLIAKEGLDDLDIEQVHIFYKKLLLFFEELHASFRKLKKKKMLQQRLFFLLCKKMILLCYMNLKLSYENASIC
ncbi:hypothetical protein KFK09_021893 [Dendrobium nobile]|uniref:Uncharacterized protein n=1 Tax=Dendrobium nobile TaxID=94219 RepID=A0A8T3AIJ9_DENNO|nr:hypothetical protein KFK09_021893 [Dendrobium nobile]